MVTPLCMQIRGQQSPQELLSVGMFIFLQGAALAFGGINNRSGKAAFDAMQGTSTLYSLQSQI